MSGPRSVGDVQQRLEPILQHVELDTVPVDRKDRPSLLDHRLLVAGQFVTETSHQAELALHQLVELTLHVRGDHDLRNEKGEAHDRDHRLDEEHVADDDAEERDINNGLRHAFANKRAHTLDFGANHVDRLAADAPGLGFFAIGQLRQPLPRSLDGAFADPALIKL
jgi:hypothetical protein